MWRSIGALVFAGVLSVAAVVPEAAAQSYGPGLGPLTWYGPFAGPYGGLGATGFGSTGWGCGLGAYGFAAYGYGVVLGLGPGLPYCGGFGNYPYLYPYFTGYPFVNGVGLMGGLALAGMANPSPFFGVGCDALLLGSVFGGQPTNMFFPGAAGQFALGNNLNLLNLTAPGLSVLTNVGTLGTQGLTGCISLR
jgi:hypothetical protein